METFKEIYYNENKGLLTLKKEINIPNLLHSVLKVNPLLLEDKTFTEQKSIINDIANELYREIEIQNHLCFRIGELNKQKCFNLFVSFPIHFLEIEDIDLIEVTKKMSKLEEEIINKFNEKYIKILVK